MNAFLPSVSVVIPTHNGASRIHKLLDALINQSYKSFELVIVVDGSTDGTEEIAKEHRTKFRLMKIVYQKNKGRAGARNRGAIEASGSLLIFYDDDMVPERGSVQAHIDRNLSFSKNVIIGGNQVEDFENSKTEFEKYRCFLRSKWLNMYSEEGSFLDNTNLYLTAANFSISKKTLQELNGFDESLSDAEDFDLAIRAFKKGVKIYFDKSNVASHEDQATIRSYIQRRRQYETARKKLYEKHPDFLIPSKKTFLKKIIYFLFSFKFWIKAIEKEYLKFLPQLLRYKIYTLTIWGLSQYFPQKKLE